MLSLHLASPLEFFYSWVPNNREYTQPYFDEFPRYMVLFGTYTIQIGDEILKVSTFWEDFWYVGMADLCDFPKCGKVECVIFVSGDLRSR